MRPGVNIPRQDKHGGLLPNARPAPSAQGSSRLPAALLLCSLCLWLDCGLPRGIKSRMDDATNLQRPTTPFHAPTSGRLFSRQSFSTPGHRNHESWAVVRFEACALQTARARSFAAESVLCRYRLCVLASFRRVFFLIYFAAAPARPCSFLLHLSRRCALILRRRKSFEERLPAAREKEPRRVTSPSIVQRNCCFIEAVLQIRGKGTLAETLPCC